MTPQRPNVGNPPTTYPLPPDWIVGFVDGEGCFHIGISRHPGLRFGRQILPELTVVQHRRDLALLHRLRTAMRCGVVRSNHGDRFCWRVRNLRHLSEIILPFFEAHPLRTKKAVDFRTFARVVRKMVNQDHLTEEGFHAIGRLASTMNRRERAENDGFKRESMPG